MPRPRKPKSPTPRRLYVPCPDPATIEIIRLYAERRGLDMLGAAEHLITYGARAWLRAYKAGKRRSSAENADERQARARRAAETRWRNRDRARAESEGADEKPKSAL